MIIPNVQLGYQALFHPYFVYITAILAEIAYKNNMDIKNL